MMATIAGDVTGLQQRQQPQNIPHLVKKIKGFSLKVKSFQNTAAYQKHRGGVPSTPSPPCTTVEVWICVYVLGLNALGCKKKLNCEQTWRKLNTWRRRLTRYCAFLAFLLDISVSVKQKIDHNQKDVHHNFVKTECSYHELRDCITTGIFLEFMQFK